MLRSTRVLSCVLLAFLVAASGCLINHHSRRVIRRDEVRRPVQFETPWAAQAFRAKALDSEARTRSEESSSFQIPFLLSWSIEKVPSENAYYNDQIDLCDTNQDGQISTAEALAFNPEFSADHSAVAQEPAGNYPSYGQPAAYSPGIQSPSPTEVWASGGNDTTSDGVVRSGAEPGSPVAPMPGSLLAP